MKNQAVFLFTFANDAHHQLALDQEWRQVEKALQSREADILFNLTPSARLEDVFEKVNYYHNRLAVFHYGGHSNSQALQLVDATLKGTNLAVILGQQQNLKLVFLNGCSNQGQVKALIDQGIPAVIATSAPINDTKSIQLAKQFYKALAVGKTLKEAFEFAAAYVNNQAQEVLVAVRGLDLRKANRELEWGLYINKEKEEVMNWSIEKLESKEEHKPSTTTINNYGTVGKQIINPIIKGDLNM